MALLDYCTAQGLDLIVWLDGTDPYSIETTGNVFTWKNKVDINTYTFQQSNPSLHPRILDNKGVLFLGNTPLLSTDNYYNIDSKYLSILLVTTNVANNSQSVFKSFKNSDQPPIYDIVFQDYKLTFNYVPNYSNTYIGTRNIEANEQILLFEHDLVNNQIQVTNVLENVFNSYKCSHKYSLLNLNNYTQTILGDSLLGYINTLLIFNGKVNLQQLQAIVQLLKLTTKAFIPSKTNTQTISACQYVDRQSTLEFEYVSEVQVVFNKQVVTALQYINYDNLFTFKLVPIWNELTDSDWNTLDDSWNTIE